MDDEIFEIIADEVVVEVKDAATGTIYRRELPIDYYENSNFLKLQGENLDGSTSTLVFYTARGIQRSKDITGKGCDTDNCDSHV